MTRVAPIPPAESDLLCEFCGYTLNGLPPDANCPECGVPLKSSLGAKRTPPLWERHDRPVNTIVAFSATTTAIIFRPTAFFQSITTRGDVERAGRFGHSHWIIASILFGIAGSIHANAFVLSGLWTARTFQHLAGAGLLTVIAYGGLWLTTLLAVRLTAWEAAYRGIRLPLPVVMRGMYYHAAHYFPVALLTLATVLTFVFLLMREIISIDHLTTYLYVLSAEVVIFAGYLFKTYWIGMRNMMYANR